MEKCERKKRPTERLKSPDKYPCPPVNWTPSPNFTSIKQRKIEAIVFHYTAGGGANSLKWLTNPESQVSAHYMIDRDGEIYQMVDLEEIAWHCKGYNVNTIGIEVAAKEGQRATNIQNIRMVELAKHLLWKFDLCYKDITAHKWSGGGRATQCPGNIFGEGNPKNMTDTLAAFRSWRFGNFKAEFPVKIAGTPDKIQF